VSWAGTNPGPNIVSPSGESFLTLCPRDDGNVCTWDTASGARTATIPLGEERYVDGWWDDHHLIGLDARKDPGRIVVRDLRGKVVRVLAEISKKDAPWVDLNFSPR
jgi:WD40 repeat protein